jgi:hypothetical protein
MQRQSARDLAALGPRRFGQACDELFDTLIRYRIALDGAFDKPM